MTTHPLPDMRMGLEAGTAFVLARMYRPPGTDTSSSSGNMSDNEQSQTSPFAPTVHFDERGKLNTVEEEPKTNPTPVCDSMPRFSMSQRGLRSACPTLTAVAPFTSKDPLSRINRLPANTALASATRGLNSSVAAPFVAINEDHTVSAADCVTTRVDPALKIMRPPWVLYGSEPAPPT